MLEYAANASKLHKAFGEMLLEAGLKGSLIQQEVAVKDLCPNYNNGRDRFDYYLPSLNVVVELHGEQHFRPVNFGGVSDNKATQNYIKRVKVDEKKAIAARDAGYLYVAFRYDEPITQESLFAKLGGEQLRQNKDREVLEAIVQMTREAEAEPKPDKNKANREYYKKLREQNKEKDAAWRKMMYKKSKS